MNSIDFNNVEKAFSSYTDRELKRAHLLFRLIGSVALVKFGKVMLNVALFIHFPIAWIVKPWIFAHFCGGESYGECSATMDRLHAKNVGSIPDYSVEAPTSEVAMDAVLDELIRLSKNIAEDTRVPFLVFKPSALFPKEILEKWGQRQLWSATEQVVFERAEARFLAVLSACRQSGRPLLVDAEESWLQEAVDEICARQMNAYNKDDVFLYNTIQMYRSDALQRLKMFAERAEKEGCKSGFKLVRGAYMEKERKHAASNQVESPIHPDKESTDSAYNEALKYCVTHISNLAIVAGTHNEESCLLLCRLMEENGINQADTRIYFSQLLGMSDHITFNLAQQGYNVAKYMPYGPLKSVMPYLIRRAEENTSVAGQSCRELKLLQAEIRRRRTIKTGSKSCCKDNSCID